MNGRGSECRANLVSIEDSPPVSRSDGNATGLSDFLVGCLVSKSLT